MELFYGGIILCRYKEKTSFWKMSKNYHKINETKKKTIQSYDER